MTILQGTMQDGTVLPVQVDAQGRLVAEGLPGPTGPTGPMGPEGPKGDPGQGATQMQAWHYSGSRTKSEEFPFTVTITAVDTARACIVNAAFSAHEMTKSGGLSCRFTSSTAVRVDVFETGPVTHSAANWHFTVIQFS